MSLTETKVNFSQDESIAVIELNRPAQLNALDTDMLASIEKQLKIWALAPTVKSVFIHSSLPKAFCAGGDVKRLILEKHENRNIEKGTEFFLSEYFADCQVHLYKKPIVAWLEGITMGGGVGLTNGATLRIATETSTFAMPEVYIGFFPDVGASRFLAELEENSGFYLGMSGDRIDARAALAIGLVDIVVPSYVSKDDIGQILVDANFTSDKMKNRTLLIDAVREKGGIAIQGSALESKALIERLRLLKSPFFEKWQVLANHFFSDDFEQMHAAIENVDNERRRSILSQALAFELITQQISKKESWPEVFVREWAVAIELLKGENFTEGVRAVLIDKDQNPDWPAIIEEEAIHEAREIMARPIVNLLTQKFANARTELGL